MKTQMHATAGDSDGMEGEPREASTGTGPEGKRHGTVPIWLSGAAVAVCLLLLVGLVGLVLVNGLGLFWPSDVAQIELKDGSRLYGELVGREKVTDASGEPVERLNVKVGHRDVYGIDFRWLNLQDVEAISYPPRVATIERWQWGNMYGVVTQVREGGRVIADGSEEAWTALIETVKQIQRLRHQIRTLERGPMHAIGRELEGLRLELRSFGLLTSESDLSEQQLAELEQRIARLQAEADSLEHERQALLAQARRFEATVELADGKQHGLNLFDVVAARQPNTMGTMAKLGAYVNGLWAFLTGEPRESNTEGGIFPALFGTVLMVMIMTVLVVPLGVCAAIYLREYAGQGPLASLVRIAVNNLAGVPSIVFGAFGLGFFVYFVGGGIDALFFPERLPTPTFGTGGILWASLTLALLTLPVVIVATEEGLGAVDEGLRQASFALGATKFETICRVVLPRTVPAILTGTMLAISRAAGEVAPLMLTGVVKLAPSLVIDGTAPYVHLQRKFMHLGFHIYDVGFQSPNVEAARPMVFATTVVLLGVVIALNLSGVIMRQRLQRKYESPNL